MAAGSSYPSDFEMPRACGGRAAFPCRPECGALKRPYQFCVRVDSGQVYASQSAVRHSRRLSTLLNAGALNHLAIRITSPFFGRVPISSFTSHRTGGIVHRTGAARILRQSIRPPGVLRYSESAGKQQEADNCKDSLKHAFLLENRIPRDPIAILSSLE